MKLAEKVITEYDDGTTKLGVLTQSAYNKVKALDSKFIGTEDYMGLAYFWSVEYKAYLRDASPVERQQVHKEFLDKGLGVHDDSDAHQEIVSKITGMK